MTADPITIEPDATAGGPRIIARRATTACPSSSTGASSAS